jgi:tetratricopeptide (TPR) repeat protein
MLEKDRETRYQHVDDLLADLKRAGKESEKARRPARRILIPASIMLVIVILFLIFKPWKVVVEPDQKVAIMYFDNLADPEDEQMLGEIVTNLLITDLSESQYVDVVSSQRLYDILKLMGREGEKKIDRDVATEVATKAQAKWMLLGNILQVDPRTVITTQLVNMESGQVRASQRIVGEMKEEVFSLVDKLTLEIKKDLSLPAVAQRDPDPSVADVTTHSPEAYRYYLEGVEYWFKTYNAEAKASFIKALEYDSTFAMAYLRLSDVTNGYEQKDMIANAAKYSDKVGQKEKYYIKAQEAFVSRNYAQYAKELQKIVEHYPEEKEAFLWLGEVYRELLGQYDRAIYMLNQAIEIDSFFIDAYILLAYTYDEIGDVEKSIWAINKSISLAPDEANPYDSRGDLYRLNGKLGKAIESYKKALEIKPDFYFSLRKLSDIYLIQRKYASAESLYQRLCSGKAKYTRSEGRTRLAYIPLYQGKFDKALEILDDGIGADKLDNYEGTINAEKHALKALIFREKNNMSLALREVEKATKICQRARPYGRIGWMFYYADLLAENSNFEKAEKVAEAIRKILIEEQDTIDIVFYWYAVGCIEFSKGNLEEALENFEKAAKNNTRVYMWYMLGRTYLETGKLQEAVEVFEDGLSKYTDFGSIWAIRAVKARYYLGIAYERSGWTNKAIEHYEEFLDIWKDADPGIEEVDDAKARLARLRGEA